MLREERPWTRVEEAARVFLYRRNLLQGTEANLGVVCGIVALIWRKSWPVVDRAKHQTRGATVEHVVMTSGNVTMRITMAATGIEPCRPCAITDVLGVAHDMCKPSV